MRLLIISLLQKKPLTVSLLIHRSIYYIKYIFNLKPNSCVKVRKIKLIVENLRIYISKYPKRGIDLF